VSPYEGPFSEVMNLLHKGQRKEALARANAWYDGAPGEVLALVANPSYDPNILSSHDGRAIRAAWKQLNADPDKPLVSVASDDFFPPGSTFKIVTAAAALEDGQRPSTTYPNPPVYDVPQTTADIHNFGGDHCLGGASRITLADALMVSCNVTFAQVGVKLGAEKLVEQAHRFGFSDGIDFDIPFQTGAIPDASAFENDIPALAQSAIGQRDVATNVLHLALIGGAIGNGGVMMEPKLVAEIRDQSGRVVRGLAPEVWGRPMSQGNARTLTQMMQRVVEAGTGTAAQIPGIPVAGKTGTAETGRGNINTTWFTAFAPANQPKIAITVVVENQAGGFGGTVAAPIAKQVMEALLR
jgi:peptidoglycan glycosyltransferase